jgi:hypothetical protein
MHSADCLNCIMLLSSPHYLCGVVALRIRGEALTAIEGSINSGSLTRTSSSDITEGARPLSSGVRRAGPRPGRS